MSKLYLLILSVVIVAGCDSAGPDAERPGLPPTLPLPGDSSGTPTPTPNPTPFSPGNLRQIGNVFAWEAVGTGYPTSGRPLHQWNLRDSTGTQMNKVRTLAGELLFAGSQFNLSLSLNYGGYDHRTGTWREFNDSLRVSGNYLQAGPLLLLEPESCDATRGPALGFTDGNEVAIHAPPPSWEHHSTWWMRFSTPLAVTGTASSLPEGTHPIASLHYAPCGYDALPVLMGANRYQSKSVQAASVKVEGGSLFFNLTYRDVTCFQGNCSSSTSEDAYDTPYVRYGDIVAGGRGVGDFSALPAGPRLFGHVQGDTLVLHGVKVIQVGNTGNNPRPVYLVARVPLK